MEFGGLLSHKSFFIFLLRFLLVVIFIAGIDVSDSLWTPNEQTLKCEE